MVLDLEQHQFLKVFKLLRVNVLVLRDVLAVKESQLLMKVLNEVLVEEPDKLIEVLMN
jgi:hypothetical protein